MLKFLGYTLLLIGAIVLVITGYQFYQTQAKSDKLLEEANAMLAEGKNGNNSDDTPDTGNITPEDASSSQERNSNTTDVKNTGTLDEGELVGILRIPSIELEVPISEGTASQELKSGVGHEPSSGLPGDGKQVFLAGHNDSTFRRAGELKNGDELIIETNQGSFSYIMYDHEIVHESETDVITPGESESLVLMTCYPFTGIGSPTERYLIYAKPK
ncbi:class D sortase [Terribacillus saccharophilus]|uniref:class D sortase n=1 Tax=Terribacillus saccharophilus TaxID=361277 RepID=UPI003982C1E2